MLSSRPLGVSSETGGGSRAARPRTALEASAPLLLGMVLAVLVCYPFVGGRLLLLDFVSGPHQPLLPATAFGLDGGLTGGIPLAICPRFLDRLLGQAGWVVPAAVFFPLSTTGMARLVRTAVLPARLGAGLFYAVNPFVFDRLYAGQLGLVLGYALLPFAVVLLDAADESHRVECAACWAGVTYNWRDLAHPRAGGAEVYLQSVAREWVKSGHEVTIFCAAVDGRPARELANGVEIIRRGGRLGVYREARRYWRREGDGQYDLVVDCVNTRPFLCPRFIRNVPMVAIVHQVAREIWRYETPWPISVLGRYLLEPAWLRAYRDVPVVTVSESSRESLAEYGLRRVKVVPEGWVPA